MLKEIIAKFLQIPEQQAQILLNLLTLERQWQKKQPLGNKLIDPVDIKTQSELIEFLQAVGQNKWFKGHDRSKLPPHLTEVAIKEIYWDLFNQLGMTERIISNVIPNYSVVLGSSELNVKYRTESLIEDIFDNKTPTTAVIFGSGGNRELGRGVVVSEEDSIDKLKKASLPLTELNMVSLIVQEQLAQHGLNQKFKYIPVNVGGASSRDQTGSAKTEQNAQGILETIQKLNANQDKPEQIVLTVYSNQPYIQRQKVDMEEKLKKESSDTKYQVNAVGRSYRKEDFFASPTSINLFLGEIARTTNTLYDKGQNPLLIANVSLTEEELAELHDLTKNNKAEQITTVTEQQITKESFQPVFVQLPIENILRQPENNQVSVPESEKLTFT